MVYRTSAKCSMKYEYMDVGIHTERETYEWTQRKKKRFSSSTAAAASVAAVFYSL